MAVANPTAPIAVTFILGAERFAALPERLTVSHRLVFATVTGQEVFADNFLGDLVDHYGTTDLVTTATPIAGAPGPWRNLGFDHLAITVADREGARDFFRNVLQMPVMRHDAHITVVATGHTAIMIFDAGQKAPLSDGRATTFHHLGFVVDDLEAACAHLVANTHRLVGDFTLLERDERWSLYFFYENGDVTLMFQHSEVKPEWRGYANPGDATFAGYLYDYASRPYGVQFPE